MSGLFFFLIIKSFASIDHRVKLVDNDGTLSNRPKTPSSQLINKVAESVVALLLSLGFLNWKLQLTLNFPHKKIVYHDVVGWIIKFILDPDELELSLHALTILIIQNMHSFQKINKSSFTALILRPEQVTDLERN